MHARNMIGTNSWCQPIGLCHPALSYHVCENHEFPGGQCYWGTQLPQLQEPQPQALETNVSHSPGSQDRLLVFALSAL